MIYWSAAYGNVVLTNTLLTSDSCITVFFPPPFLRGGDRSDVCLLVLFKAQIRTALYFYKCQCSDLKSFGLRWNMIFTLVLLCVPFTFHHSCAFRFKREQHWHTLRIGIAISRSLTVCSRFQSDKLFNDDIYGLMDHMKQVFLSHFNLSICPLTFFYK